MFSRDFTPFAEDALAAARAAGFTERSPAPLASYFWGTTLAPSSTEVIFSQLRDESGAGHTARVCTLQPCVRFTDIAPWSDGVHLPYFTLFSCFVFNCEDPLSEVRSFLSILNGLGAPVDRSWFTYYAGVAGSGGLEAGVFGESLLAELRVPTSQRVPCRGLANYERTVRKTEAGGEFHVIGPKIEVFDTGNTGVEYATLISSRVRFVAGTDLSARVLQMGAGVERLTLAAKGQRSFWQLEDMGSLREEVLSSLFAGVPSLPLVPDIEHALELFLSLLCISRDAPDLVPGGKNIRAQLRRIVRITAHKLVQAGVEPRALADIVRAHKNGYHFGPEVVECVTYWLESELSD